MKAKKLVPQGFRSRIEEHDLVADKQAKLGVLDLLVRQFRFPQ
jgi:hypothetical protein